MYKLADHGVIRIADGAVILPRQEGWDEYLQYITDGNIPLPHDPAPSRPLNELRAEKFAAVRSEAYRRLSAKWPMWKQVNAALGLEPALRIAEMKADIAALRGASNTAEAAIAAATTQTELDSVLPNWPTM